MFSRSEGSTSRFQLRGSVNLPCLVAVIACSYWRLLLRNFPSCKPHMRVLHTDEH